MEVRRFDFYFIFIIVRLVLNFYDIGFLVFLVLGKTYFFIGLGY